MRVKAGKVIADIAKGRAVALSKSLYTIEAIQGSEDAEDIAAAVLSRFCRKLGSQQIRREKAS